MSALERAALYYAEHFGWPVLPLGVGAKEPMIPAWRGGHGVYDASRHLAQIRTWWRRWPHANIGLASGEPSGLFVLDLDPRNGGDESLAQLEAENGPLPATVECLTGGFGRHLYFRGAYACTELDDGIEIKGTGGYVVLPPSIHPNGRMYLWDASSRPGEVLVADPSPWLRARLSHHHPRDHGPPTGPVTRSFLAKSWALAGWRLGFTTPSGVLTCQCPWLAEHSRQSDGSRRGDSGDTSTALLPPTARIRLGGFCCHHAHCAGRDTVDVLSALPEDVLIEMSSCEPELFELACSLIQRRSS